MATVRSIGKSSSSCMQCGVSNQVKCTSQARTLASDTSRHFSAIPTTQPGHTHATPMLHYTRSAAHIEFFTACTLA